MGFEPVRVRVSARVRVTSIGVVGEAEYAEKSFEKVVG